MLMLASKVFVMKFLKPEMCEGGLFYYPSSENISVLRQKGRLFTCIATDFCPGTSTNKL